jgi:hypothetical protein
VIVINQTMARTLWPGQNAIGQTMRACGERHVVGVVGDVRHLALEQASGMEMYLPMRQCTDISSLDLVIRTSLAPAELAASVRAALKPIAPNLPGNDFRTLQQLVDKAVSPRRFVVLLHGLSVAVREYSRHHQGEIVLGWLFIEKGAHPFEDFLSYPGCRSG